MKYLSLKKYLREIKRYKKKYDYNWRINSLYYNWLFSEADKIVFEENNRKL